MSKYEVSEGLRHGGLGQHIKDRFAVTSPGRTVAFMLTEAEARIFEFGLNAIADGKSLMSPIKDEDGMYRYAGEYLGPTDGIKTDGNP